MRLRYFVIILSLAAITGCGAILTKPDDRNFTDNRLKERAGEFHQNFIDHKFDKMWDMRSDSFKSGFSKDEYIEYLKGDGYKAGYYRYEKHIDNIQYKEKRARVKMTLVSQATKDSLTANNITYDFWVFENGDWRLNNVTYAGESVNWLQNPDAVP